jgi:hypothetical protein
MTTDSETPIICGQLLQLIVCPLTGAPLIHGENVLLNERHNLGYPIRDGVLLLDPRCSFRADQLGNVVLEKAPTSNGGRME